MRATVLIPTFDHGPLLEYSVDTARRQTVEDIEIFIVGDGIPAIHRDAMDGVVRSDPRIRFFDFEKGPRHGEIWRHEALGQASGEIVCYLSDDDLWFPNHIEEMERLLVDAEFANTLPVHAQVTGELHTYVVNLSLPGYRELFFGGNNRVPLTCAGHTMAAYRRSAGWRTTPEGAPTDLYMWQELLRREDTRSRSGFRPTSINFPSPFRMDWSLKDREAELRGWWERVVDADGRAQMPLLVLESQARLAAKSFLDVQGLANTMLATEKEMGELRARLSSTDELRQREEEYRDSLLALKQATDQIEEMERLIADLMAEGDSLRARINQTAALQKAAESLVDETRQRLETATTELRRLERVHHEMASTATWRMREMTTGLPVIGPAARWVARALTRRGGP